jgi:hypothetical protein
MKKVQKIDLLKLGIVPVLLFSLTMIMSALNGPFYLGPNLDPEYAYLFNSLDVADLSAPGHVDHPGTPLQVLGAIVILLEYGIVTLFRSTASLEQEVLLNPESYLRSINFVLNCFIFALTYLAGLKVFRLGKSWILVVSVQLTPLLFATLLYATMRVSAEPLLIVDVLLLYLLLIPVFLGEYRIRSSKSSIFLGIILGLAFATKVTSLPLILLILLPKRHKDKALATTSSILTFFILTLPIWSQFLRLGNLMLTIALREGRYGSGEVGLPAANILWVSLKDLVWEVPGFFLLVVLMCGFLLFLLLKYKGSFKRESSKDYVKALSIITIIMISHTVITVKHPPVHYMLPSIALVGLTLILLSNTPDELRPFSSQTRIPAYLLGAFLTISIILSVTSNVSRLRTIQNRLASVAEIEELIDRSYQDCEVITYYRSSSMQFALAWGNGWSKVNHGSTLIDLYSAADFYKIWVQEFFGYELDFRSKDLLRSRLSNGECLLMQGPSFSSEEYQEFATSLEVERLYGDSDGEVLYRLLDIKDR